MRESADGGIIQRVIYADKIHIVKLKTGPCAPRSLLQGEAPSRPFGGGTPPAEPGGAAREACGRASPTREVGGRTAAGNHTRR